MDIPSGPEVECAESTGTIANALFGDGEARPDLRSVREESFRASWDTGMTRLFEERVEELELEFACEVAKLTVELKKALDGTFAWPGVGDADRTSSDDMSDSRLAENAGEETGRVSTGGRA